MRYDEVSLGYPRDWRAERGLDWYLREILPGRRRDRDRFVPARDPFSIGRADPRTSSSDVHAACEKLRVLVLMHDYLVPPDDVAGHDLDDRAVADRIRRRSRRCATSSSTTCTSLGVKDDLAGIRQANDEFKPHIAFNLLEAFHEIGTFDQNVVSYLELLRLPYTGCNPRGMFLARDKSLSKKLLHYHRIPVPEFRGPARPQAAAVQDSSTFPLIVKSLTQEASIGISQASVVDDEAKTARSGCSSSTSRSGPTRSSSSTSRAASSTAASSATSALQVLPVWEMTFAKMPEGQHRIATERVKWNAKYQEKMGIATAEAKTCRKTSRPRSSTSRGGVQSARAERLRAHRPAARRKRPDLRARGQPESADRPERGLRRIGSRGRPPLSGAASANPDDRHPMGTRTAGVGTKRSGTPGRLRT